MSGNGIRCLGQAARRWRDVDRRRRSRCATARGPTRLRRDRRPIGPASTTSSADMGAVEPDGRARRLARAGRASTPPVARIGNPHLVLLAPEPGSGRRIWTSVGRAAQRRPSTAASTSRSSRRRREHDLRLRVYERGVGITEACGTGALRRRPSSPHDWGLGPRGAEVLVRMDGGGCDGPASASAASSVLDLDWTDRGTWHRRGVPTLAPDRPLHPGEDRPGGRDHPAGHPRTTPSRPSTSWRCWSTRPAPTPPPGSCRRRAAPDPTYYIGKGKAEELKAVALDDRRRHRGLRRRAHPGPAVQPGEAARADRHRPHRGDPRHLRPERPHPRGQGPGRAGPVPLPPAPPAAGAAPGCPSRRAASAPGGARARPSSRSTGGASSATSTSSSASSGTSGGSATPSARPGTGPGSPR